MGSKNGAFCLKQVLQGMHCIHERSLPVSAMPKISTGGVPIDIFMRYSPVSGIIVDSGQFDWKEVALKIRLAWLMERCKAFATRFEGLSNGL